MLECRASFADSRACPMVKIGQFNRLPVLRRSDFGLFLDAGGEESILLPRRDMPADQPCAPGDLLDVFVYHDSEDRPVATTRTPKVQVGEFASLKVVDINSVGLFLDWGLAKDLLLPHSEEKRPLQVGDYCVVYAFLDDRTGRVTASARIDRYLDKTPARYRVGEPVNLLITTPTEMGYKAIINHRHWGLLHRNELFRPVRSGMHLKGYIRELRSDGKISLSLQPQGEQGRDDLAERILTRLRENQGTLPLSDKSTPAAITAAFGVSKSSFKKAIGGLYKTGQIAIHPDHITLLEAEQ